MHIFFHFCTVDKPDLVSLQDFPFSKKGPLNIISRAAAKYEAIGTYLLNDKHGNLVQNIQLGAHHQPVTAMRMIFQQWVKEDTECSWKKLIQCLKTCEKNCLAQEIEDGLKSDTESCSEGNHCKKE